MRAVRVVLGLLFALSAFPASAALAQYGELPPVISGETYTPNPSSVLSGVVAFTTNQLAIPSVIVEGPDGAWVVPPEGRTSNAPGTMHRFNVLGLRAEESYTLRLGATNLFGLEADAKELEHTTGALPAYFPSIQTLVSKPEKMEPGVTRMGLTSAAFKLEDNTPVGLDVAVDAQGRIVWYLISPWRSFGGDFHAARSGNLLFMAGDTIAGGGIKEVDVMGEIVKEWDVQGPNRETPDPTKIQTDSLHHAFQEMTVGDKTHVVFLSTELRELGGYSKFGFAEDTQEILGDVIVEFDPETVAIEKQYTTFDHLDPLRVDPSRPLTQKADFSNPIFDVYYKRFDPTIVTTRDWTHGNGVVYDAGRDAYIVSLRHQDIVYALARETGDLLWVVGSDDPETSGDDAWPFAALSGGGSLPYHTHDPTILPNGDLMVYDNGVVRPEPFFARAAQFRIDTSGMEPAATQVWDFLDQDYNGGKGQLSIIIGAARLQPAGKTVLVDHGAFSPCSPPFGCATKWTPNLVEVAYEVPQGATQEKVWEIDVGDRVNGPQVLAFRAERHASLYPSIKAADVCAGTPKSTEQLGLQVELQNVVDGKSVHTVGSLAPCLAGTANPSP